MIFWDTLAPEFSTHGTSSYQLMMIKALADIAHGLLEFICYRTHPIQAANLWNLSIFSSTPYHFKLIELGSGPKVLNSPAACSILAFREEE